MPDEAQEAYAKQIAYLEHCLDVLNDIGMASDDLTFLQTFLTHAQGYLSKDVTPDTEAVENWDSPENQAMIQRYLTHVEQEIRLFIEEWQHAHPEAIHMPLGARLQALVAGLDQVYPTVLPPTYPQVERNGNT